MKRTHKQRNSNLLEVCFSSTAVVSKNLLGYSGHFLPIVPFQSNSTQCNMHDSRAHTENCINVVFHRKQIVADIIVRRVFE